jgi:diadenosine tetraphosphate (Ap4A) HIT family hydrolase
LSCLACDTAGAGGVVAETPHWIVDHTIGSLGAGTLIVKPKRHVLAVGALTPAEAEELGPLLQRAAASVQALTRADQVYVCLWSHMNREPGHIHFVVQPVTKELMAEHDLHGPQLQVALFEAGEPPDDAEAAAFAAAARAHW